MIIPSNGLVFWKWRNKQKIPLTPFQGGVTSPDLQELKFELTFFDYERKFKSGRNAWISVDATPPYKGDKGGFIINKTLHPLQKIRINFPKPPVTYFFFFIFWLKTLEFKWFSMPIFWKLVTICSVRKNSRKSFFNPIFYEYFCYSIAGLPC